jgi:hypothetical protein
MKIISTHPDYSPNDVDYEIAREVAKMQFSDYSVEIREGEDCSGFLYWSDGVANEWCEHFVELSHAFARLATLQSCAETVWRKAFADTPEDFSNRYRKFLLDAIQ